MNGCFEVIPYGDGPHHARVTGAPGCNWLDGHPDILAYKHMCMACNNGMWLRHVGRVFGSTYCASL